MRPSPSLLAQIGRLATPAEASQVVCRVLPWVVSNYKLDELSSVRELRRNIALLFRKHSHVTAPGVVDILIYKGREELEITDYVNAPKQLIQDEKRRNREALSPFMERFYTNIGAYA
eukprot:jgi/Astpho2/5576/Aster-02832